MEGLTESSRIVANRRTLRQRQVASLCTEEKEKILQAVDGKSGSFPQERPLDSFTKQEAGRAWNNIYQH